jgi:hypothetical protein
MGSPLLVAGPPEQELAQDALALFLYFLFLEIPPTFSNSP